MNLTEKFIEVNTWTTSRKIALLGAFSAALAGLNTLVGHVLLAPLDWVDLRYWDTLGPLLVAQGAVMALVAWRVGRSGAEGRWTAYAFGLSYGALLLPIVHALGYVSTGIILLAPIGIVTAQVLFDARLARAAFIGVVGLEVLAVVVTATGWMEYAPALDGREVDLLGSWRWVLTFGTVNLVLTIGTAVLVSVIVGAARLASGRLGEAQQRLSEANRLIARYVPAEVAQDILEGRWGADDGHERRRITVFFSDLVGFSDIAEELEPEDLALVLNEYFGEMTAVAHRHHGTVDELQGDALLILFGAPHATTDKEHALNAVRMAGEMHSLMEELNARWRGAGITETLSVRMGINTGVVTVGNFGTASRMKYAALGKHVNVAARLQAVAEPGSTVISYSTYLLVKDELDCTPLGLQQLKGITKPVEAFVLG